MPRAMCAGYRFRPAGAHFAVKADNIVIAYVRKSPRKVAGLDLGVGKFLSLRRGRAVQYDFINLACVPGNAKSRPGLCAHYAVGFQSFRRLELFDSFLGQRPEYAVRHQVQFALQGLHFRPAAASFKCCHSLCLLGGRPADYRRAAVGLTQRQANAVLLEVHEAAVVLGVVLGLAVIEFG